MRRLTHILVLAAFVFSCGGQWTALQCVAWINMIHEYAEVVPLAQAVSMTFSGQYPCEMCKTIAEKKESESSKTFALQKAEKKFFPPLVFVSGHRSITTFAYATYTNLFVSRTEAPPTPPPRQVLS